METRFTSQAMRAYIEQSRGAMPSMLSTDAAMADWVADSNMRRVGGQFASFTIELHGPVQWLEPTPPVPRETHETVRLFTPVQTMPGQTTLGEI